MTFVSDPRLVRTDITKQEAARRQTETATRLFFADDDPISVHVLISSAQVIVTDVCRARCKRTIQDTIDDYIKPEYMSAWRKKWKAAYNYFKHAERDAEIELAHFNETINEFLLFAVGIDYQSAFGEITPTIALYRGWYIAANPESVLPTMPGLAVILDAMGPIHEMSPADQKRRGLQMLDYLPDMERFVHAASAVKA